MKPIKFLSPIAKWVMRSGIILFALFYYVDVVRVIDLKSAMFYVSFAFVLFSATLFVGGFLRSASLTVVSALALAAIVGYQTVIFAKSGVDYNFAVFVIIGSVLLNFIAKGNNS